MDCPLHDGFLHEESDPLNMLPKCSLAHLFAVSLVTALLFLQAGSGLLKEDRVPSLANISALSLYLSSTLFLYVSL